MLRTMQRRGVDRVCFRGPRLLGGGVAVVPARLAPGRGAGDVAHRLTFDPLAGRGGAGCR
jgi:hypothetical protein